METTIADKERLWRALASYIEECRLLATEYQDDDLKQYYTQEVSESYRFRKIIKQNLCVG